MRWFVEISPLGDKSGQETTLCVEAPQWQPALQKARSFRGDNGAMSNFSIELLDDAPPLRRPARPRRRAAQQRGACRPGYAEPGASARDRGRRPQASVGAD